MDGELPTWTTHNSCNTAEERQEEHDVMEDSCASGEPVTPLSSCMSGAFKALLPDYHGASSAVLKNSDKYHSLCKPGFDEKTAVESDCTLASATHMLPLKCAQYVTHEKSREVDRGNGNWTSVIKDSLEMSNGMEMEQTLSMNERGPPLMDYNSVYKGPETEAKFRLKDCFKRQGVKEDPNSVISMLSDDISKNKDVLEMGKHEEPSLLDVESSLRTEGLQRIREREPGFNRSSYTPYSSNESEQFPCKSVDHTLQSSKDVSPGKPSTVFKHTDGNDESVPEGSAAVHGLHHLDLQKGCHQAEVTDGETTVNPQDCSSHERLKTSNRPVSETAVIKQNPAYLPNSQCFDSELKKEVYDLVPTPASVSSQNTSEDERENLKPLTQKEERISSDIQETSTYTNTELTLKEETKTLPEIQNSETVQDLVHNKIKLKQVCFQESASKNETQTLTSVSVFTERKADECDIQEKQTPVCLNVDLLPYNENGRNSESIISSSTEDVHEAPTKTAQCNPLKALPKKARKRKQSELEALKGAIYKSNKRDDCAVLDSAVKLDTTGCKKANQNTLLADLEPKEENLIINGDVNPSEHRKKCCTARLEDEKPGCSEASQEGSRINRKKLKNKTRLCLKAKESGEQCFSQSTALSPDEDGTSHFQLSDATPIKEVISSLESITEKKTTKETLQNKDAPMTFSEVFSEEEEDVEVKGNAKGRRLKAFKRKNKDAAPLLDRQSSQDSEGQTDESLKILSLQNNPKKSKQNKRVHISKSALSVEDMENMITPRTKTMKEKSPLKKPTRIDDNESTYLDTEPSTAKQTDWVANVGNVERKSPKKKQSRNECETIHVHAVDQLKAQESVLHPPQESDVNMVQTTAKRLGTRKKLSLNAVGENFLSSVNSECATETDCHPNTEKKSSKRRKTDLKLILSTNSQQDTVTSPASEDVSSVVVTNPAETVKAKGFLRNKTSESSLLTTVTQESILATKSESSSCFKRSSTPKKSRKKSDAAEMLCVNQHEDLAVVRSKTGANIASCSQMTLKEKRAAENAVKDEHSVKIQACTLTQQQTECFSAKKCKKISEEQTMQQEIHADNSDVVKQKTKKQPKKATKCKRHITQDVSDVREQSAVQQESSGKTKTFKEKETSTLEVTGNDQQEDALVSQSKDATQDPCIKTDDVIETAGSHVCVTTKDTPSPQSSLKVAKKTPRRQSLQQKDEKEQSNILELEEVFFETDSCDQDLKVAKKKPKKSKAHGFADVSLSREENPGSDEAGVMVTFTQVADLCKLSDGQSVGSQEPEEDDAVIDQKDFKATNTPKRRGRKPGRKKRKMACLLSQTIKEEGHVCDENRTASDFQDDTQIQRITDVPEEPTLESSKSTRTQKINSHGESTVSGSHTTLGETLTSSMQPSECDEQYNTPRRGRPPSKKRKKLIIAHLEDSTSPSVQKSDLSPSHVSTDIIKPAVSPIKQNERDEDIIATKQSGSDPLRSLQSDNDALLHSIPSSGNKTAKRPLRDFTSLRASSRTCVTSVKGFQKADTTSLPQHFTDGFNEEETEEETVVEDGNDIKIENKATVKVLRGRKRGRKRRKVKDRQLQRLTTQDCCEAEKGLLKNFCMIGECPTEDQNNREKNYIDKTKSVIPPIITGTCTITPKNTPEIICSDLSCNLVKCKVEEPDRKVSFEFPVQSYLDNTGVSRGITCSVSSDVVKEESDISLDTQMRNKIELKCTQQVDEVSVDVSRTKVPENTLHPSIDSFKQDSVVMPNRATIRSKPKEIAKKPLTCKYCGVSFRHITAYSVHQRLHTGDRPYKCKICGKAFSQLSQLKSHRDVHKRDSSFPCPCCSRRFLQKDDLICHFKVHLKESEANSDSQKRNKSSNVTVNDYGCLIRKKNIDVEKLLTCKDCGKTFGKPSKLTAHEKTHWPVKPYACSICGKGFKQLKALKKHSQGHAGETPFSCFHCGHGFTALSALRMHQASKTCIARKSNEDSGDIEGFIVSQGVDGRVNTPVFFKCQICKELFRKWCQYTLHLQTHTSSPPYICFSCGQCYEKDSEMNVHCEVCCQSSGEEKICGATLTDIMQSVTHAYPLKCTKGTSRGFKLNSQTQTDTEERAHLESRDPSKLSKTYSPIKLNSQSPARSDINCTSPSSSLECIEILQRFKCSRCGQRFARSRDLSAHLQTHASGFRYTCAQCGQFFERWSKLWLHQRRHRLKSRCYSCTQCNLQFRFFSSFREHMISHAGQLGPQTFLQEASLHTHQCESHELRKSLKCDVCSKTFSSLAKLIKHSLLHNGSTSHICLLCNRSFANTRVLQEHLKTHTPHHAPALPGIPAKPLDFPHKCKRCKASFSTGDLLYAHHIRHSRDAKTQIRPTSKLSASRFNDTPLSTPHIANLKLDDIPNDDSLYVYSHPDKLYVSHNPREQLPVINLDPDPPEISDSPGPELLNTEVTSQSDSTQLPQATSVQETTNLNTNESIKTMINGQQGFTFSSQRSPTFVETSVDMEAEHPTREEESEESFECADCTEKLTSVLGLYEHYILHAMGDAYVQVH